jgi:uncharacterized protein (AIM24 family)
MAAHEVDYRIVGTDMQFVEIELDPGESAVAEAGAMMYMTGGVQMETKSLPLSRLAGRIFKAIPGIGGSRRDEGSILGGIGDLLDGDR